MKTNVEISLEGEEALGFLHRLANKMCTITEEELGTPVTGGWEKNHNEERHCTLCGVRLVVNENIPQKRFDKRDHTCSQCRPHYSERKNQQRNCYRCGAPLTDKNRGHSRVYVCTYCTENILTRERIVERDVHIPTTADERTEWSRERRAIVGKRITQPGKFEGALIKEHIRGSLYIVEVLDGQEMHAHHKKQKTLGGDELGAGWRDWEKRP
tara:strand:- start:382 stop:1017 length:636 start_codon:yes stop_codon:yes gene_type:complete